ncbi:MAG: hypothetical protein IKM49_01095, partial [Ruminococcus sp.]|nr:hypothetical protein [Ruminococcus sp.]
MKKTLSAFLSAVLAVSSVTASAVCAQETAESNNTNSVFVMGDSIASGTSMGGTVEHKYGDIIGDYLGWEVDYYAKDGLRTDDLISALSNDAEAIASAEEAEVVVISIGGNNMLRHMAKYSLEYARTINSDTYPMFKEGYSSADIPEDPTLDDMNRLIDKAVLMDYFEANPMAATPFISGLKKELAGTTNNPTGLVQTEYVPETAEIVSMIKELNPDAQIIIQTVYQPVQFAPEYWSGSIDIAGNET